MHCAIGECQQGRIACTRMECGFIDESEGGEYVDTDGMTCDEWLPMLATAALIAIGGMAILGLVAAFAVVGLP